MSLYGYCRDPVVVLVIVDEPLPEQDQYQVNANVGSKLYKVNVKFIFFYDEHSSSKKKSTIDPNDLVWLDAVNW